MCVKMKTRQDYLRKCARCSVDVFAGVRIARSYTIMNVVIDVRIVECHASIHVVIGVRVALCHPLVHNFGLSTLCPNSHRVVMLKQFIITFTCSYFAHVLHRGNTSFEVWYLHGTGSFCDLSVFSMILSMSSSPYSLKHIVYIHIQGLVQDRQRPT